MRVERLPECIVCDPMLIRRGRDLGTTILIEIGSEQWLLDIVGGKIISVRKGPHVMPRWSIAFRASRDTWEAFAKPVPDPGFNDILGLVKRGTMRIEGDMLMFMSHLLYFKSVLAGLRSSDNNA